jgi:hypothetical protein
VSKDKNIEAKIHRLNNESRDSRIIVPLTNDEILDANFTRSQLENKFRKYFYNRDLFALESPLQSEAYFYGRNNVVQTFYDKYTLGENSGLFGLRKIGKTSVLFALQRLIELREGISVYIDCQDTGVHKIRWYELLYKLVKTVKDKYELQDITTHSPDRYNEKTASDCFEQDLLTLRGSIHGSRVMFIFDEIEHISFQTSSSEHWRSGEDYLALWQTLRAILQRNNELFCFLIVGVNPLCVEKSTVNEIDNPIFDLVKPVYLSLFDVEDVTEMVRNIGSYMGLKFDGEIYSMLTNDYGGHPFLIRHVCSLINGGIDHVRPYTVTKFYYKHNKASYDRKIQHYIQLILNVLAKWYPEEYNLLGVLVRDGSLAFKKQLMQYTNIYEHLFGYGIVKEDNGNYFINISAVEQYLKERLGAAEDINTKEGKWKTIAVRRNTLEEQLRNVIKTPICLKHGKATKEWLLQILGSPRREDLAGKDINTIFTNHLLFSDLSKIVIKEWATFEKLFVDRSRFELFMEQINKFRVDAHAKEILEEDFAVLTIAFRWVESRLEEMVS